MSGLSPPSPAAWTSVRLRYPAVIVGSVSAAAWGLGPGLVDLGRLRTWHDCRPGIHRPRVWWCWPNGGHFGSCSIALGFGLIQGLQFLAAQVTALALGTQAVLGGPPLYRHGDSGGLRSRLDLPGRSRDPVPEGRLLDPRLSRSPDLCCK